MVCSTITSDYTKMKWTGSVGRNPGAGNQLPRTRHRRPLPQAIQVNALVDVDEFPANYEVLMGWTNEMISRLSILLNDDFGIRRGDSVVRRRLLLLNHLTN